jgi:hypothetical protein
MEKCRFCTREALICRGLAAAEGYSLAFVWLRGTMYARSSGVFDMGLLDELEEEANKRREGEEGELKRKREFFQEVTVPAVENLYSYLQRLAKTLNFLKSERRATYNVAGYGPVVCRINADMAVQAQMPMYSREVKLTVTGFIDSASCPVVQIDGASRVETMQELFRRAGFDAMQKAEKDERGAIISARFQAVGKIQMVALFAVDMHSDTVRMEFANFDALMTRKHSIQVSALNDEFLDSIGKYLAHQQNYIARETVSDENREAWRAKLQQEQQRRQWEQKIADVQAAEEAKLRSSSARITGKIKAVTAPAPLKKPATSTAPAASAPPAGGLLSKLSGLFGRKDK